MLRLLLLLTLLTGLAHSGFAQDTTATDEQPRWAMLLQLGPHFDFTSFQPTTVGIERYIDSTRSARIGFTLGADYTDRDLQEDAEQVSTITFFALHGAYVWYRDRSYHGVRPYLGVGPLLTFRRDYLEEQPADDSRWRYDVGLGVQGMLGTAWRVHPALDLLAQYSAHLSYQHVSEEDVSINRIALDTEAVRVGVALRF